MNKLDGFVRLLSGGFDNSEQFERLKAQGVAGFPFAVHKNTVLNDKIRGLPEDFKGLFLLEESYYTTNEKTHPSPHLFLFTQEGEDMKLTSYDMPEGYDQAGFTYEKVTELSYEALRASVKFTPAIYKLKAGVWEGGSVSFFSPAVKFTLFERFTEERLEVSEVMEVNGKKTLGFEEPIIYKRT